MWRRKRILETKKMARNNIGIRIPFTDYSMAYTYDPAWGRHYRLKGVAETHYRTEGTPTDADNVLSTHSYDYDPNGNLSSESVSRKRYDNSTTTHISERKMSWDGLNRLRGLCDNGYVSLYWYDADGNRTVKEHLGGEAVWVNGTPAGVNTDTLTYSIYPNPYISITGDRWTKHYYIGGERIASRTGTLSGFNSLYAGDNYSAGHHLGINVNYENICIAEEDSIAAMYERFGVPYEVQHAATRGEKSHLYIPITKGNGETAETSAEVQDRNHPHLMDGGQVYYFQRDHLGSTLTVTDSVGATVQRVEYTPWGEVFVELKPGSSGYETPYLFNGKELDDETGLYYYGARYYDPKLSVWNSIDPLCEKYYSISPYAYCGNNPVIFIDPSGESPIYDTEGNFLGTDDHGIFGPYFVMDKANFTQGMSLIESGSYAISPYSLSKDVREKINSHYSRLSSRPDYDGFVTISEGVEWAKQHVGALKNPTPDNMLYINTAELDFGNLSASKFKENIPRSIDLFDYGNDTKSTKNPRLAATVYALGTVKMILINRETKAVIIYNDYNGTNGNRYTDYDWNRGGSSKRDIAVWLEKIRSNIPEGAGFRVYYYGVGHLNK